MRRDGNAEKGKTRRLEKVREKGRKRGKCEKGFSEREKKKMMKCERGLREKEKKMKNV